MGNNKDLSGPLNISGADFKYHNSINIPSACTTQKCDPLHDLELL